MKSVSQPTTPQAGTAMALVWLVGGLVAAVNAVSAVLMLTSF